MPSLVATPALSDAHDRTNAADAWYAKGTTRWAGCRRIETVIASGQL
jgi:hypothetical protein